MRIVAPLIVFAVLILAGCATPSAPITETIRMVSTGFDPATLSVKQGTDVCFVNEDIRARWPASNIHPTHEIYSDFDPKKPVPSGETWCFTFTKSGIWNMHDHLLPEFVGTVTVE